MAQPTVKQLRELLTRWHEYANKASGDFQQAATLASMQSEDKPAGAPIGKSRRYQAGEHLGHATGLRRAAQELRELIEGKAAPRDGK